MGGGGPFFFGGGGRSSPEEDKEEEAGRSDSLSESDWNLFLFRLVALRPLACFGGGGGLAPSLSSFTFFASPTPIFCHILPSSHPNYPDSAKCVH